MRCHPLRWLWGLIPVAMLSWLAVHLESSPIERDLEHRSTQALAAAGFDWASVAFSGRDGLLVGRAADVGQRDRAAAVVGDVWGVRIVETRVALAEGGDLPPPMPQPKPKPEMATAPWSKVGVPAASAAKEINPHRTLNDVVPSAVGGPSADDVALATGDIGRSVDLPPASTVQARDEVETPATAIPAETAEAKQTPLAAEADKSVAGAAAPVPNHKPTTVTPPPAGGAAAAPAPAAPVPQHMPVTPTAPAATVAEANPAPPVPERKPAAMVAPAPPAPVATAEAAAPLPEKKPAAVVPSPTDAKLAAPASAASVPPLPERSPRFETAALPPGNIGPETDCIGAVRATAQPVELHFAHGLAKLDNAGKVLIDRLIGALNTCPEAALNVAGHSDASGHPRRNLVLSKRRAHTVTSYMIHKGIDVGRLVAIGYGDKRPAAPNDTQANRAKNRRIEVAITARAAPLPPLPVRKQGTEHGLSRR
jgi:outer membrane protein OmpA-like peptidoglycan-associated protein